MQERDVQEEDVHEDHQEGLREQGGREVRAEPVEDSTRKRGQYAWGIGCGREGERRT